MALQKCGLNLNSKKKELQPHGSSAFPCAGYESSHSDSIADIIPWHWHEELEIIYIKKGTMKLQVLSESFMIHAGEIAVINANVLHQVSGAPYGELQSLVFSPLLVTGSLDSAFALNYIMPMLTCTHFSCVLLKAGDLSVVGWFQTAFDALKNDRFAYEFIVREQVSHILLVVYQQMAPWLNEKNDRKDRDSIRITQLLNDIQQHFAETITLSDMAQIANLSEREVLRCFKRTIGESPMQYLLKYRIMQSASMLIEYREKTISEVAQDCGFVSPAYYTKKFKEYYLCTPNEYRKMSV